MSKKIIKPVSAAIGTVLLTTLSATTYAAEGNPFAMKTLSSGYMQLASADDAKKGEQDSQPSTDQKRLIMKVNVGKASVVLKVR